MKAAIAAMCLAVLAAGCTLPETKGPARVCVPMSAICYFPDDPRDDEKGPQAYPPPTLR